MIFITIPKRWIFAFLSFLGSLHVFAMMFCLSITLTEMVVPTETETSQDESCSSGITTTFNSTNYSTKDTGNKFEWSDYTQSMIVSSFYYTYIISHIPGGQIAEKYGGKHTVGLGLLLSALLTLSIPLSVSLADSTGLVIVRALIGLCLGVFYPAISTMVPKWTPFEERSRIGALIFSGEPLGMLYANFIGGLILYYFEDWRLVFYLIGGSGVLWYGFWLVLCYESPDSHPFISDSEKKYLQDKLKEHVQENSRKIPWKHILTSVPMWACIIAFIGFDYSVATIIIYLPKYVSSVLKFSVDKNANLNSGICLCLWTGSLIASFISDFAIGEKKIISVTSARKIGSTISLFGSACFFVGASYAGCDGILVTILFSIAMLLISAGYACLLVNLLDLSPNYAGILMALGDGVSFSLTGAVMPFVVGNLTPNQTLSEWRLVYWILFAVSISTNVVFLLFGSADVQHWNNLDTHCLNNQGNRTDSLVSANSIGNTKIQKQAMVD